MAQSRIHLVLVLLGMLLGCRDAAGTEEGRPEFSTGKSDVADALDVKGTLQAGEPATGELDRVAARHGYVFFAEAGASLTLEITQAGSTRRLDSVLRLYGPRAADSAYGNDIVASDDESGWGQLSRIADLSIAEAGHYLVEVAVAEDASPSSTGDYRLLLTCDACDEASAPVTPVAEIPDSIHWTRNSAEFRASTYQAYRAAASYLDQLVAQDALPEHWAVVFDADDTILSNSQYEKERAELGLGYSSQSWAAWVARREATAVPGSIEFMRRVRELGGVVAVVTNRKAAECEDTKANLEALGLVHDVILCRTGTREKEPRWNMVEAGTAASDVPSAEIVVYVGDNIEDFPELDQDIRHADRTGFADFGTRYIVIPNPMYGSWTSNPRE